MASSPTPAGSVPGAGGYDMPPGGTPGNGGSAGAAQQQAQGAVGQAQEKVSEVAGQAQEQARSTLRDQVDQRSTQAGEQISTQASDIRTVAEKLREEGKEGPAKVAEQAAERAEKIGGYLSDSSADRILHDVEDYARRSPWTVVAGGLALGFVASRFLKASSTDRYHGASSPAPSTRQLPARSVTPPPPAPSGPPVVGGTTGAPAPPVAPGVAGPPIGGTTSPGTGTF